MKELHLYALTYLTFNGFYLVIFLSFLSLFLNEMGEIICTTTERGSIIYDGFSYRVDRARPGDKVIDWRCTYKSNQSNGR